MFVCVCVRSIVFAFIFDLFCILVSGSVVGSLLGDATFIHLNLIQYYNSEIEHTALHTLCEIHINQSVYTCIFMFG